MVFPDADSALDGHEVAQAEWLAQARAVARRYAIVHGVVSSDEVWTRCPPPAGVDGRVMGAVFRRGWRRIGWKQSERRVCHGRPISVWGLAS